MDTEDWAPNGKERAVNGPALSRQLLQAPTVLPQSCCVGSSCGSFKGSS